MGKPDKMKLILASIFSLSTLALSAQSKVAQTRYGDHREYILEYTKTKCNLSIRLLRHDSLIGKASDFCDAKLSEDIEIVELKNRINNGQMSSYILYEVLIDGLDDGILKMIVFFEEKKVVLKGSYAKQSSSRIKSKVIISSNKEQVPKKDIEYYLNHLYKICTKKSRETIKLVEG